MKSLRTLALLTTTLCGSLQAQNIDYGAFETLFNEPVTASATGKPQRASDSPVGMEIITADQIKRSGVRDIPQILRRYAGVDVMQSTMGQYDVSARGYNASMNNRVLVLINGRQVLLDHYGEVRWNMLPVQMEEIRQIEVVKGPNSSLFGYNAEQGVINIITYNPLKDDVKNIVARGGTQHYRSADGVYTLKPSDNLAVRISGGHTAGDEFSTRSAALPASENSGLRAEKIALDGEYQIDADSLLRLQASSVDGESNGVIGASAAAFHTQDRLTSTQLGYQRNSKLGLINFDVYRNAFSEESVLPHNNLLWVVKASDLIKPAPAHTLRLGMEYRHNSLSGQATQDAHYQYNLFSPSAMWDWQLTSKLDMVTAVRQDIMDTERTSAPTGGIYASNVGVFDRNIQATTYNLSFLYKQDDTTRWRLATGRGMHIPSLIEMGSGAPVAPGVFLSSRPTLSPESNTSYEIGVTKRVAGNVDLAATGFYEDHRRFIDTIDTTFYNVGNSKAYGLELSAKATNQNSYWGSNLTLMKVDDQTRAPRVLQFEDSTPDFKANIFGGLNLTSKWQIDAALGFVPATNATIFDVGGVSHPHRVGSYFTDTFRLNYAADKQTDISLNGYNLLEVHREGPGPQAVLTGSNAGMNNIGHTMMLTLSRRF